MPAIRRTLKNVVRNYSDAQVKVREATSNDPWGPSSTLMSEIADLTYNVVAFTEIMQMVWKRLNDDGKNWRHVYKSLMVLEYIIKTGSEKVAQQCKENFHAIKTLTSFQYMDADNKDQGMNVREKAKHLVSLLSDDERLKNERAKALKAKERFAQNAMGVGNGTGRSKMRMGGSPTGGGYSDTQDHSSPGSGSAGSPSEIESARPSSAGEEELQLQLALAMSKEEHDENVRKQKSDDIKLQMALEQSREQAKTTPQSDNSTLLNLARPSGNVGIPPPATDPWGTQLPVQPSHSTDPWGTSLPDASNPDPWSTVGTGNPPAYSPTLGSTSGPNTAAPQIQEQNDPWGLPSAASASVSVQPVLPPADAWSSSSPITNQQASTSPSTGTDPFGLPTTNGASSSNNIDTEFDLLSARCDETSPSKSAKGLEEFDLLSGGTKTNGTSGEAWDMSELTDAMPSNKKKSAEDFLGANANLVNLDQLVSKAPAAGNNPFAMSPTTNNPFHDPTANMRTPMAQMQTPSGSQNFTQPVNTSLLPAPLLPVGNAQPMQPSMPAQQSYNPFL